ncbi:deaminase [Streptomyces venezuelae]|uniref:Deaminase n=1 Tax=Streptomyces venezuelae TaxID=54571 RepID=A0A5P2CZL3_STRVZ|nr:dihydrofolate reductase family protein [Streptomyces venezuelae]QES47198.1 deaminase [Streptomyces venezuelae]
MGRIILPVSVSLDGFIEGPGRELDWHLVDDELHTHFNEQLAPMGAFLSGRVTHELMAAYWPTADENPAASRPTAEFAAIWRDMPKYVFSRTLEPAEHTAWNTTVVRRVDPAEIEALKAAPGGDLALGGADLAASFMRYGLIDEYRLYVHPVLLGSGKRLFPASDTRTLLRTAGTHTFGNGVVLLRHLT